MISIIDALVINTHLGNDVNKIIEDCQIINDCTETEAVEFIVSKLVESTTRKATG